MKCFVETCKVTYKNPNKKINFNDWFMKKDHPVRIVAEYESRCIPEDIPQQKKLFINKPVAVGDIREEDPFYENLKSEKYGPKK